MYCKQASKGAQQPRLAHSRFSTNHLCTLICICCGILALLMQRFLLQPLDLKASNTFWLDCLVEAQDDELASAMLQHCEEKKSVLAQELLPCCKALRLGCTCLEVRESLASMSSAADMTDSRFFYSAKRFMTNDALVDLGLEANEKPASKCDGVRGPTNSDTNCICCRS